MDRLPALIVLAALAACEDSPGGAPPSRVDRVAADPAKKASADGFCDVRFADAAAAPAFALPRHSGAAPAGKAWRWVNVWATWCKPCVAEMGMLRGWRDRLARDGRPVDLLFVSADERADDVAKFQKDHPEIDASLRLEDPDGLPAWLGSLGLDAGAPIPIHVLVDPAGKTRCARAGAVSESDYPAIVELLAK